MAALNLLKTMLMTWRPQNIGATSLIIVFNLLIYLFLGQLSNLKKRANISVIIEAPISVPTTLTICGSFFPANQEAEHADRC